MRRLLFPVIATFGLASCGGGDGTAGEAPPNRPPSFTSATTVSVIEGAPGTVYTAAASDPDGNNLTYSITGGADAARFQISTAGALSFVNPPDFEAPTDADRNNVYDVQIGVSDGIASASLALEVTVSDSVGGAFRVRRVTAGLAQPLYAAGIPDGSGRLIVVQQGGLARIVDPSNGAIASNPFLDVGSQISTDGERGLLGLALAPDFAQSGTAYVYLTNPQGNIELRRYQTYDNDDDRLDPATADVVLTIPHPGANNHNGGWIDFGPDGFLYVSTGDGGGSGDPAGNAQNKNALLGKMLRIDVSRDDFPNDAHRDYGVPASNPFATSGGAPEIWAYGLRNAFRNSFDRVTGNLYIGDVGQGAIEEIDLMQPNEKGFNFGWPLYEGTQPFAGGASTGLTFPVAQYAHGTGPLQGNSITGGYVYRGPLEILQGQYIFGDFVRGAIWSVPAEQLVQGATLSSASFTVRTQSFTPLNGTINNVASFGQDQAGNLYIVDYDGELYVIEPA